MRHPSSRSERRFNGEVFRDRQRFVMKNLWWHPKDGRTAEEYWQENNMWWARKQCSGHGNRCSCHCEKTSRKEIRKRRRALDRAILESIQSF